MKAPVNLPILRPIYRFLTLGVLGAMSLIPVMLPELVYPPSVQAQAANRIEPTTPSNQSQIKLAQHLKRSGAIMYGSFRCPYCHNQKELFGREAAAEIPYIECHPDGENAQIQACMDAKIKVVPTWEINGKRYEGTLTLAQLAEFSNYQYQKGEQRF